MLDISKCHGTNCELAEFCYRFTADEAERQSWIEPDKVGADCEYFEPSDGAAADYYRDYIEESEANHAD